MIKNIVEKLENKKVFALYLVGVLLLSTGVSFAYFSVTNSVTGSGGVATGVTATVESEGVQADGNISFSNLDIYPGHQAIASIKVTGTGNNKPLIYNVIFNGNNTFNTPINYTIYKTEENIDANYNCSVKEEKVGINTIYYEECTGSNIDSLGNPINSGTITKGEGKTTLKSDEIILTEPEGKEVYYYIVFEYPNLDASQNDDIGSTIKGNITIEEGNKYKQPELFITAATISGSNGWYKSASLTTSITTQTENYDVKYCITTENSCTPNTDAVINDNQFNITLNNNAKEQRMCIKVVDEYEQVKGGCSEGYKVDNGVPTSNVMLASSSTGSNGWYKALTLKITGSDSHSGVESIKYCTTTLSTCNPITSVNGSSTEVKLNSDVSAQRVCAQAIDNAGNISAVTCSNGYSVDITNPTINITDTSSTSHTINITVNGSDAHSGIYQYKFSSNGGSSFTTIITSKNTYTYEFTNLNGGTTYNIAVQAVDKTGNISNTVTKSITTKKAGNTMQEILEKYTKSTENTYNGFEGKTTNQVYQTTDWLGTTYYFAGQPTDNWVKFGDYYWRIIRMNGDGSTRLIYSGESADNNINNFNIGENRFNNYNNYSYYVGLSYNTTQHGSGTNSSVLDFLNNWYSKNLIEYEDYIDSNVGFCSDRNVQSDYIWEAEEDVDYAAWNRLSGHPYGIISPTLQCNNTNDILRLSIGLITADEVSFSGITFDDEYSVHYLYSVGEFWTMTPNKYQQRLGANMITLKLGSFSNSYVTDRRYVRPVINLKASTLFMGSGTVSDPYVVAS